MNAFWNENGTKILGALTAGVGAIQGYLASGAFEKLLSAVTIGWMGIILGTLTAVLGGATMARGFSNSAQVKVAEKFSEALNTPPPPKQGGFARVGMLVSTFIVAAAATLLAGCVTTPTGEKQVSEEGKAALEIAARIGMRHFLADERAVEKIHNIREVVAQLQALTNAESTLAGLTALVSTEIEKLNISPIDKADAQDLLTLLSRALEAQLGPDALNSEGVVKVNEFLKLVLSVIPSGAVAAGPTSSASPPER